MWTNFRVGTRMIQIFFLRLNLFLILLPLQRHFHVLCLSSFFLFMILCAGWKDKGWRQNCSSGWWIRVRTISGQGSDRHTQYALQGQVDLMIYDTWVFFVCRCPVWFSNIRLLSSSPSAVPRVSLPLFLCLPQHLFHTPALALLIPPWPPLSPPPSLHPLMTCRPASWGSKDQHSQLLTPWAAQ